MKYKGALIGKNISYSYSKIIHEYLGTSYDIISINSINGFISLIKDYDFINVTSPFKTEVIKYLDDASMLVKNTNSCNLVVKKNGKLIGYNTDFYGFISMMRHFSLDLSNKNVLILGTGGASKTIQKVFTLNNSNVILASRTGINNIYNYDELNKHDLYFDYIVNATPIGNINHLSEKLLDLNKTKTSVFIDLNYNPYRSLMMIENELLGSKSINGLYMLIYQAVYAYNYLEPKCFLASKKIIKELYDLIYKPNIVTIGMMLSGKSTYSKMIYSKSYDNLYDIDEIIEEKYGPIDTIIKDKGLAYFRQIEKDEVLNLNNVKNSVISPGGGVILDLDEVISLKQNGVLYFIDTDFEEIKNRLRSVDRPLAKTDEELEKIYSERIDKYHLYKDKTIKYINGNYEIDGE